MMALRQYAFAVVSLVAGCATAPDLAKDPTFLSEEDRVVARRISELAALRCTRYTYDPASGARYSGDVKINRPAVILNLSYSPKTNWFKAESVTEGVWDSLYYHKSTGAFICGEKAWSSVGSLRAVTFTELKSGVSSMTASGPLVASKNPPARDSAP